MGLVGALGEGPLDKGQSAMAALGQAGGCQRGVGTCEVGGREHRAGGRVGAFGGVVATLLTGGILGGGTEVQFATGSKGSGVGAEEVARSNLMGP